MCAGGKRVHFVLFVIVLTWLFSSRGKSSHSGCPNSLPMKLRYLIPKVRPAGSARFQQSAH